MPNKKKMKIGKPQETRNEAISCVFVVFLVFLSMKISKADY
jgi:nitrate reductase NapE component